jgi:hypothetical protein
VLRLWASPLDATKRANGGPKNRKAAAAEDVEQARIAEETELERR